MATVQHAHMYSSNLETKLQIRSNLNTTKMQSSWNADEKLIIVAETAANTVQSSWNAAKYLIVFACYRVSMQHCWQIGWNASLWLKWMFNHVQNRGSHSSTANDYWQQKLNWLDIYQFLTADFQTGANIIAIHVQHNASYWASATY